MRIGADVRAAIRVVAILLDLERRDLYVIPGLTLARIPETTTEVRFRRVAIGLVATTLTGIVRLIPRRIELVYLK